MNVEEWNEKVLYLESERDLFNEILVNYGLDIDSFIKEIQK
ncbi:hypothetical protein [Tenacibaculum phage Larrie]|nr:hypothetical protein [Tenacibaculum phage Larrie]